MMNLLFQATLHILVRRGLHLTPAAITDLAIAIDDAVCFTFEDDDIVTVCFSDGTRTTLEPLTHH